MALTVTATTPGATHTSTTASATLVAQLGQTFAVGDQIVVGLAMDNAGSAGAANAFTTASFTGFNGAFEQSGGLFDNGAAAAGVEYHLFAATCTSARIATDTITFNFSPNVTAKCVLIWKIVPATAAGESVRCASAAPNGATGSTTGTPTITTGASVPIGAVTIGFIAVETNAVVTADADTTNGSWSAQTTQVANTTVVLTSMRAAGQFKTQTTAASTQTYNPTLTSADLIIAVATFVGDGTTTPAAITLAATVPAPTASGNASVTPAAIALSAVTPAATASSPSPTKMYLGRAIAPRQIASALHLSTGWDLGNVSDQSPNDLLLTTLIGAAAAGTAIGHVTSATLVQQTRFQQRFVSNDLAAGTILAGTWTFALAASETNVNANAQWGVSLYVERANAVVGYIFDSPATVSTEPPTTVEGKVITFAGVSQAVLAGDRLVLEVWTKATQSIATAYTLGTYHGGQTEPTEGLAMSATTVAAYLLSPDTVPLSAMPRAIVISPDVGNVLVPAPTVTGGTGGTATPAAVALAAVTPVAVASSVSIIDATISTTFAFAASATAVPTVEVRAASVRLHGLSTEYLSTPDSAALDVVGDIEIVVRASLDNWNDATNLPAFLSKYNRSFDNSYAFCAYYNFRFQWSPLGSAVDQNDSANHGLADYSTNWAKVTVDVDNGAGGKTFRFYKAVDEPEEPTSWTQVGSDQVVAGTTSIFAGAALLTLGICGIAASPLQFAPMFIHRAIVRNGIAGTKVLDFDARDAAGSTSAFASTRTGETWTFNGSPTAYATGAAATFAFSATATATVTAVASPAAITLAATVPAPTASGNSATTPAAIALTTTVPAPTVTGTAATTPAAITRTATVPAPTARGGSNTTPAAIALTTTVPAPTTRGSSNTSPAAIARSVVTPAPFPAAWPISETFTGTNGSAWYLGRWDPGAGQAPTIVGNRGDFTSTTGTADLEYAALKPALLAGQGGRLDIRFDNFIVDTASGIYFQISNDPIASYAFLVVTDGSVFQLGGTDTGDYLGATLTLAVNDTLHHHIVRDSATGWLSWTYWLNAATEPTDVNIGLFDSALADVNTFWIGRIQDDVHSVRFDTLTIVAPKAFPVDITIGPDFGTVLVPAPTARGGSNTTPAAITRTVVTPAPTVRGGSSTTPAAVTLTATVPAPTASGNASTTPAAIALTTTVPAPTAGGGASTTPAAIPLAAVVPAPTASGTTAVDGTATPTAITLAATTPAPTASGSSSTTPAAIALTVVVPAPTATGGTGASTSPAAITLTAVVAAPSAAGGASTTPASIPLYANGSATAPAYRGVGTTVFWDNSVTAKNIANPVGTVAGDLLIMLISLQTPGPTIATPTGWTLDQTVNGNTQGQQYRVFHRIADLSATDNPTLTPNILAFGGAAKIVVSGVDQTTPISFVTATNTLTVGGTTLGPSLTAVTPSFGVSIALRANGAGEPWLAADKATQRLNDAANWLCIQIVTQSGTGEVGAVTHNYVNSANRVIMGGLVAGVRTLPAPTVTGGASTTPAAVALPVVVAAPTGSGGATTTPAAIALTVVVPAPTASGSTSTTPAAIPLVAVVPAPTTTGDARAPPAAVALAATTPAPTATGGTGTSTSPAAITLSATTPPAAGSGGSTTTPATIALAATLSAPTVTGTAVTTPAAIALSATTSAPTAGGSSTTTPAAIALAAVVPAPTATGGTGSSTTPAAITLAAVVPAPTASGSTTTTPAAIALAATLSAPTVTGTANTSPAAIPLTVVTPAPTVSGASAGQATPAVIALSATIPPPTASGNSSTTPAAITLTATTPAGTESGGSTTTPAAVARAVSVPAPAVSGGAATTPATIPLAASTPPPTASGATTTTPAAIALAATVPAPSSSGTATTTPAAITRTVVVPAPTATGGTTSTANPAAIALAATVPAPTARGGAATTPAAITLAATVPAPTGTGTAVAFPAAITLTVSTPAPAASGESTGSANPPAITLAATVPAPTAVGITAASPAAIVLTVVVPAPAASGTITGEALPPAIALAATVPAPVATGVVLQSYWGVIVG